METKFGGIPWCASLIVADGEACWLLFKLLISRTLVVCRLDLLLCLLSYCLCDLDLMGSLVLKSSKQSAGNIDGVCSGGDIRRVSSKQRKFTQFAMVDSI